MNAVLVEVKLEAVTCCVCGVVFGLPSYLKKSLKSEGGDFWCPNGHRQYYTEPEIEKLKKQLAQAKRLAELRQQWYDAEREDHAATKRSLSATKGALTRTKKRVAAGVCPCCKRHFENLERHMHTKHPDYAVD
jgi:hypothetical protein